MNLKNSNLEREVWKGARRWVGAMQNIGGDVKELTMSREELSQSSNSSVKRWCQRSYKNNFHFSRNTTSITLALHRKRVLEEEKSEGKQKN